MLIVAKIVVTFLTVVLLAKVAERLSPKHAGLLAGFPLGTAIALYFYALQQGTDYAAQSAIHTIPGLTASMSLAYGYWWVIKRKPGLLWLPVALVSGLVCFFISSNLLSQLPEHRGIGFLVVLTAIFMFRTLFKEIENVQIAATAAPTASRRWVSLLFRAAIASATILFITAMANVLGPTNAGLLAAFPISFLPLMLILHITYGANIASAAIRHYPDGLGALAIYALAVSYLYPLLGQQWGTAASLGCSVLYLVLYSFTKTARKS